MGLSPDELAGQGRRNFLLHGVQITVAVDDPGLDEAVTRLLGGFEGACPDAPPRSAVSIDLQAIEDRALAPLLRRPAGLEPRVTAGWPHAVWHDQGRLAIDFGERGSVIVGSGHAAVFVPAPQELDPEARAGLLYTALCELLAQQGLFALHAAAVCDARGRGVLIAGRSGAGKTTAALALVRGGWCLLSDDHPLIRDREGALELLPFPVHVDVTERTVEMFAELAAAPLDQGTFKQNFDPGRVYPGSEGGAAEPGLLLFPKVTVAEQSVLEPLSPVRALEELVREGLAADGPGAREHLSMLTRLVEGTPAFRLWSAGDVARLPELISEALP